jgi:hypothetical protein
MFLVSAFTHTAQKYLTAGLLLFLLAISTCDVPSLARSGRLCHHTILMIYFDMCINRYLDPCTFDLSHLGKRWRLRVQRSQ